jgi:hypothetical protein
VKVLGESGTGPCSKARAASAAEARGETEREAEERDIRVGTFDGSEPALKVHEFTR